MPISTPKIPEGLPELMRGLAKSVIKENPDNLYVHAAEYFENLIRERDGELERGYQTFNAYQVYADYKEKNREKLGLTRAEGSSISGGEEGDESGSGGSGTKSRGRKRARRGRKQSSREKDSPPTMVEKPPADSEPPKALNSLSEESAPVPVVEQEVVKVHYNPPEAAPPAARVVSAQSVEAEQAVSSVLDDEQILDSDGTNGSRETGDELVVDHHGDDVGSAPSTAEIAEPRPAVEENGAMALQDMETCFMHANVDDLLEKHSADPVAVDDDSSNGADVGVPKMGDILEGEDIPEGPQFEGDPKETLNSPDSASELEQEGERKENDKRVESAGKESGNEKPLEVDNSPIGVVAQQTVDVSESTEGGTLEKSPDDDMNKVRDTVDDAGITEPVEDKHELLQPVEEVVEKHTAHHIDESIPSAVDSVTKTDLPMKEVSVEQASPGEPQISVPLNEKPEKQSLASDAIEASKVQTEPIAATKEVGSLEQEQIEKPVNVTSRMGTDEAEDDDEQKKELPSSNDASNTVNDDKKVVENAEEPATEEILNDSKKNSPQSSQEEEQDKPEVKKEQSVPNEQSEEPVESVHQTPAEANVVDEGLIHANNEPSEEIATHPEVVSNEGRQTLDSTKDKSTEREVLLMPDVKPLDVNPVEETITSPQETSTAEPQEHDIVADAPPVVENNENKSIEKNVSKEVASTQASLEKVGSNEEDKPSTDGLSPEPDGAGNAKADESIAVEKKSEVVAHENQLANDNDSILSTEEKRELPSDPSTDQGKGEEENSSKEQFAQEKPETPSEDQCEEENLRDNESGEKSSEQQEENAEGKLNVGLEEKTVVAEQENIPPAKDDALPEVGDLEMENAVSDAVEKEKDVVETVNDNAGDVKSDESVVDSKPSSTEVLTLERVAMDTLPELLADGGGNEDHRSEVGAGSGDEKPISSAQSSSDQGKDVGEESKGMVEGEAKQSSKPSSVEGVSEQSADVVEPSGAEEKNDSSPEAPGTNLTPDKGDEAIPEARKVDGSDDEETKLEEVKEEPCVKREKREVSLDEVNEEPCIKREITPAKSSRPDGDEDTGVKQVEEREEIKKVDLSQLSKDSAEALFYSLKKSELENQEEPEGAPPGPGSEGSASQETTTPGDDDDKDVVVLAEAEPAAPPTDPTAKRTFTNDFLDEIPITDNQSPEDIRPAIAGDGVQQDASVGPRSSSEAAEQEDEFNPMVMVSMRSKQFQEQLHSRENEHEGAEEQGEIESRAPARPLMRRCMTEMAGLQRYDTLVEDDPVESRATYVEEEDQFDGYYIGHIKNKILASSVSVADSDYFDPAQSTEEPVDESNVRTALETIASTDTESTIASQATIQQAGKRSYLRKHSQNTTSSNIPYASFGNAAIDQSLDEFIEREERNKRDEAMAEAATKIQRSYRTHKKRLLRDYHSTMRTFTEDQSAESGEECATNVIKIKLDQRLPRADDGSPTLGDGGEESDTSSVNQQQHLHQPLLGTGKRPMYSLNIDEYDTVARRMTLTRGVALQRNSTPEDDSGKSANDSTDRKASLNSAITPESALASSSGSGEGPVARDTSSEEKSEEKSEGSPKGGAATEPIAAGRSTSVGEQDPKEDGHSSSRSRPHRITAAAPAGRGENPDVVGSLPKVVTARTTTSSTIGPLDVQSLLLIARQRTMPVQIDSSVIRVLPKHMRKRISSAGMLNGGGKRKL